MISSECSVSLKRRVIYVLLAICVVGSATVFAQTGPAQPDSSSQRLDEVASSFTKDNAFMGAVLVANGPTILLDRGYGKAVVEWNIPNSPDVKFRIGSMTKQFTAALVLLAQEEGKLSVDDPVRKYLPDSPAAWEKVTIGDLLHHTSGIPNFIFDKRYFEWRMVSRQTSELLTWNSMGVQQFQLYVARYDLGKSDRSTLCGSFTRAHSCSTWDEGFRARR
jgi:CubicO group peptidase (beta-lactamase class C family)